MNLIRRGSFPIFAGLVFICLTGCSGFRYRPERPATQFLHDYNIAPPSSPMGFVTCNHYGCEGGGTAVSLSTEQWQGIYMLFMPPSTNGGEERDRIAEAVALMERIIGKQNNTFADQACNNFKDPIESYQHDCVAETINTSIYLLLLEGGQLLRWHQVGYPANRSVAGLLFPHFSAVIQGTDSADLFAVDSWFYPNGEEPVIVPLHSWRNSYYPPEACQ